VSEDRFVIFSETGGFKVPNALLPGCFLNHGNYIVSLGNVCRWLAQQAEALGVEIYPGFAGAEVLYNEDGSVRGVATGDMGIGRDGQPTDAHTSRAWSCWRSTPSSPRAAAATSASSSRPEVPPAQRRRPAGLRHRHQGAVGDQAGTARQGPGHAHRRLADGA
jgi:hypothetical protein